MSVLFSPVESPNFTRACYRCDKTIFVEVLMTAIFTLLAQAVLTLRSVFLGGGGFALITVE